MGLARPRPRRDRSRLIPRLRTGSDRRKVAFFEYGNEYDEASGKFWVYVDIINGNADLVDYVGFRFYPSLETHNVHKRTKIILTDGTMANRFTVKQHSVTNWSRSMTIVVHGKGGSRRVRKFKAKRYNFRERPLRFVESKPSRDSYLLVPELRFGVELEMSLESGTSTREVVDAIQRYANVEVIDKTESYYRGSEDNYRTWQLVPDGSVACSISNPNCNRFELVSRILIGENGLVECQQVLKALLTVGESSVNKSMGFHVHVDVKGLGLETLKNICLNFIKHESVIDSFMTPSRQNSEFCKSNRNGMIASDELRHNAIITCRNLTDLCEVINPGDSDNARYYKLNLQNLNPGASGFNTKKQTKSTIEFRQHSGTTNYSKIEAWVRFCTAFCQNSMERPAKLKAHENAFDSLFDTVIQDLKLKDFYRNRRDLLAQEHAQHLHRHYNCNGDCPVPCGPCAKIG